MSEQAIPPYITKYFWGDDLNDLNLHKNKKYIIQTILDKGDLEALRWLFLTIGHNHIKEALPTLRLSKRSDHFWKIYLS